MYNLGHMADTIITIPESVACMFTFGSMVLAGVSCLAGFWMGVASECKRKML